MQELLKIRTILSTTDEVAIISHYNPDGDALGSQMALSLALEQLGIKTVLINRDGVPQGYRFLSSWRQIKPLAEVGDLPKVVIFVDCATLERSGYEREHFQQDITLINIDHHVSNENFGHINWIEDKAAATAEMIYDLIGLLQVKIDGDIATALYTGISTDTGSFLYENTTHITHRIASDLISRGADIGQVRINYYESISKARLQLLKMGLNNLSFDQGEQISWMAFTHQELKASQAADGDGEGLINYVKNISGVELALLFREIEPGKVKLSLRSKTWFDVNSLAANFGGGGHPRAAGAVVEGEILEVIKELVGLAKKAFSLREGQSS